MTIYNLFKIPLTSAAGQWCRFAAIILFALCFVGVSGAAVIKFGEIKPPIASTVPTGQDFLGNDFEVTPPPNRYAARNDEQLGLSPPRRIQMQEGRQLQTPSQVVITLRADNIQVRARWQVSNNINAFYIDEYGDGALYLTADINNIVTLDVTVYLEDDFKLLNSAYDNLMAAATIRVEVMLGTISIINPPLLYAAAGVAEIVHIFLPQGGKKPYQYITPSNIPSGFTYENGTLSIQANAAKGEYRLTVEIADAHNITAMAVATVTVESPHMIEVQSGGAVFISQGQKQSIADGMMFKFNPKSSSGVLVSATAESTVALMAPDNAWEITIYGGSQASFVGNGNGAVAVSLEGDSDFVRDTAAGAEVSLEYVFRRGGVVEAIVPIMPIGTRIFCRSQGGEWYLVIDEGSAQFAPRGGVNFLALNDAEWLVDGQTPITAQEFKFDDFMIATVAHRYTGDVGSVIANYGVAPSFSLVNGAALVSDRIGTQYYPRHSAKIAVEGPQGPLTLSYTVVAEDRLGDMLGGYGYTNRMATVTATVVVMEALIVANFVGSSDVIYGPDAAAGKGAIVSITLSYPPQADHSVLLSVNSDTDDYTLKVLGSDAGISCDNGHCSLLISEGQISVQLSVLTGTDISLSIVASDGEFVVRVYDGPMCLRTQQVRDEIILRAGKSDCTKVTSADLANITGMYLQNDGIASLQYGDFDGLGNLQFLYLDSNALTDLPSDVFDSLGNLQLLGLSSNALTDLPNSVFDDLGNLQELSLDSNALTDLPSDVFDSLGNLQQLGLSSNALPDLPSDVFDGLINLQGLGLSSNALTDLPSDVFDGLINLQGLGLSSNALTDLPSDVFDGLINLQGLYLFSNALTTLPSDDVFDDLGNLQYLDLSGNALTALPNSVFDDLGNLQTLYLHRNALTTLPSDVFDGLDDLKILAVSFNPLAVLPDGVFDDLGNLLTLHSCCNALSTLPNGVFDRMGNLQNLDLAENALATLPSGAFNGLGSLQELYLHRNTLTTLPSGVFNDLGSLQELYLKENALTTLPSGVFNGLGSLQRLGLSNNALTTLPSGGFNSLGSLQRLGLSNNALTTLPSGVFDGLDNLQRMGLYHNALTTLPSDVFDGLGNLQRLYLGGNTLTILPSGVFDDLGSLQRLGLNNNTLAVLPDGVFDDLGNLVELYLNHNPLTTLPRGVFDHLGNLEFLYLNNNACSFANQRSNLGIADPAYVTFGSGNDCLALFDAPPLPAIAGLPYALYHMAAQGGVGDHTYNIIGGNDSKYFAIDTDTGELSITTSQSQVGQYTLTIQVADGDGITQTAVATVHIASQQQTPQMAGFVGTVALLEKSKAAAGEGAIIDIAALYPVQSDSFTVSLAVDGGSGIYTLTATGVDFSCQNGQCSLVIPQGQREVQLSVLTQTDLSLFITAGGSGTLVVDVVDILPICDRTPQIRDEIVQRAGKSACDMVTVDDLIQINQIEADGEGITSLQPRDFSGLDNLQGLNLLGNSLTVLPSGVFDGLSNLRHLDLGTNDLTEVPSGVFDDLVQVQHLHLNGNALTTLPSGVFNSLRNVLHIDLRNNALTTLPAGIFDNLDSLEYLHLHNNALATLPYNVFGNLGSLQELYLNDNPGSCSFQYSYLGIGATVSVNYGC